MAWFLLITFFLLPALLYWGFKTKPGITTVVVLTLGMMIGYYVRADEGQAAERRAKSMIQDERRAVRARAETASSRAIPVRDSPSQRGAIGGNRPAAQFAAWRPGRCPELAQMQAYACRDEVASGQMSNLCSRWENAQRRYGSGAIVVPPGAPSCTDGRLVNDWTVLSMGM